MYCNVVQTLQKGGYGIHGLSVTSSHSYSPVCTPSISAPPLVGLPSTWNRTQVKGSGAGESQQARALAAARRGAAAEQPADGLPLLLEVNSFGAISCSCRTIKGFCSLRQCHFLLGEGFAKFHTADTTSRH